MNEMGEQEIHDRVKAPVTAMATGGLIGVQMHVGSRAAADSRTVEAERRRGMEAWHRIQALDSMNRAQVGKVFREDWIDRADVREIATTYAMTRELGHRDPRIREAGIRIARLVHERYGVDPSRTRDAVELERALYASDSQISESGAKGMHRNAPGESTAVDRGKTSDAASGHQQTGTEPCVDDRLRREAMRLREAGLAKTQIEDALRVQVGNARPVNEAAQAGARGARTRTAGSRSGMGKAMGKTRDVAR